MIESFIAFRLKHSGSDVAMTEDLDFFYFLSVVISIHRCSVRSYAMFVPVQNTPHVNCKTNFLRPFFLQDKLASRFRVACRA
jgi:hypothetical protein